MALAPQKDPYEIAPGLDAPDPFNKPYIPYKAPDTSATPSAKPEQYPVQYAQAQEYAASPAKNDSVDPKAFQTAINQMRTKMESNNKLINAKNATFKHMYDQPLTDEEKASLTPSLAHAISTGNRSMIDAAISDVNQQIKGYNSTIDTNLAAYSKAVEDANQLKQDVGKSVLDYTSKGVDPNAIAGYITTMGMDPSSFGFNGSISIPQGTLAAANNNPGNLKFVGQAGATMGEGGFAKFDSPEAGYQALQSQIQLDASRGQTLSQFISKYAPPTENNTSLYLQQAQQALGVGSNTPISQIDTSKLAAFMAKKESGTTTSYALPGGAKSNDEIIAEDLVKGMPPSMISAYGGARNKAIANAQRLDPNYDPVKADLQYQAAKKWTVTMNSSQMVKFQGLAGSVVNTIDEVKGLSQQMQLSGVPLLNATELAAYVQTQGNSPQGQLASQYMAAVNTLKEEFANLANGGYAPTDAAWGLANSQINANYGVDQLNASLTEVQRLINYRMNAFSDIQPISPGSDTFGVSGGNTSTDSTSQFDNLFKQYGG